ncbi:hypothetical protein [Duganella sp. P38]|uniref:hypothetical protein n=1 Tax=Duganella sp. P38 TaxID=3423949 RepID=UPI003D790C8D
MLNSLLAAYLLLVLPAQNMWRSLRPKADGPPRALMRRYWTMIWKTVVMLALLAAGSWQAGYGARDLGFDLPLSNAGAWGMGFAVALFAILLAANRIMERRSAPEKRVEAERKLLASSFPWPRTGPEALAFIVSISLMTAGWEIVLQGLHSAVACAAYRPGGGHRVLRHRLWPGAWLRWAEAADRLDHFSIHFYGRVCVDQQPVVADRHPCRLATHGGATGFARVASYSFSIRILYASFTTIGYYRCTVLGARACR